MSAATRTDARLAANARARAVLEANAARVDAALDTQDERLAASQELLDRGTRSRLAHLDVLDESTRLAAERRVLEREGERLVATAAELAAERISLVAGVRSRLTGRRAEIEARRRPQPSAEELVQSPPTPRRDDADRRPRRRRRGPSFGSSPWAAWPRSRARGA